MLLLILVGLEGRWLRNEKYFLEGVGDVSEGWKWNL